MQIEAVIDNLFRRESRKILAGLTRVFGVDHLDLAENVVQDALLKAVQVWPIQGIPKNPAAWITTVAKNRAIDLIRGDRLLFQEKLLDENQAWESDLDHYFESELKDEQLKLLLIACHPEISKESRVALALKTLYGLSASEISRAFLTKEETIEQRLVRAKKKIRELQLKFELPALAELRVRVDSALEVLYLLFNEGYSTSEGESLTCEELCLESIRITELLLQAGVGDRPKIHALLALMYLQASRLNTRIDPGGEILLLSEQDRNLWNPELVERGLQNLAASAEGMELSEFHLQAGIAATHATAENFASTDWEKICAYYNELVELNHNPVVALNRAVAIAMRDGPEAGLKELDLIRNLPPLRHYHLFPATYGELLRQAGRFGEAIDYLNESLKLVKTAPERRLIERRLQECKIKN